jgi:replicative DNA helicase
MVSTGGGRDIYKIRMSYAAFKKMSYQRLHEFSLRRPDLPERERRIGVSAKAKEFYGSVQTSLVRDTAIDESDKIASLFYRASEQSTGIGNLKELSPTLLRRLFDESRQVLATPSAPLNHALAGGLYPGYLYVVASFPGSGMTSFVLQVMNSVAANQNGQCLFVGFQQGIEELFKHSLSAVGNIPAAEIDEKRQHPADLYEDKAFNRRIFTAYEQYQKYASNITILEGAPASNLAQLSRLVQEKKEEARSTIGRTSNILIVIDSLQLMVAMMRAQHADLAEESGSTGQLLSRWDVDTLTSRLKALARELDVTILATFEYYISHRGLFSELSENDPATRELLFNTQFADVVMVLLRQGNSLLNLKDYFKTHLISTPREHEIEPLIAKLTNLEEKHSRSDEFQALTSEFVVLDIVKNRSGPSDKVLYIHKKPVSLFESLAYKD